MVQGFKTVASPVGALTLIAGEAGLAAILWETDDPARVGLGRTGGSGASGRADWGVAAPEHPVLVDAARQLAAYFAGERRLFDLPLDARGTAFQKRVWAALRDIPFGETRSYAEIARAIGAPGASRAVGAANGRNPLSIVVPCHRVIGASGALTGFAGGLAAKAYLLRLEGADIAA